MFKGGEEEDVSMKVARRNVRRWFYLFFFFSVGPPTQPFFFFLSCKVSGRSQSQAASGGDTKSKTLHVWALTACQLITPFISHQPLQRLTSQLLLFCISSFFVLFLFCFVFYTWVDLLLVLYFIFAPRCCRMFVRTLCRVPALLLGGAVESDSFT